MRKIRSGVESGTGAGNSLAKYGNCTIANKNKSKPLRNQCRIFLGGHVHFKEEPIFEDDVLFSSHTLRPAALVSIFAKMMILDATYLLSRSEMLLLGLLLLAPTLLAQEGPCDSAPNPTAKAFCLQLHKWDEQARKEASKKRIALPPGIKGKAMIAAELAPIASSIYQCMDLTCMCTYLRGTRAANGQCVLPNGQMLRKAIR
ncbi:hypothetical protein NECAME_05592 [Necator americanus]|uniref:Uncharacterized protein n=1 Tax=Necator americanus TaxID=51031 RepID=W2SFW0_NECAM|nr:hypothetical protein NECAME_05592 [Necator americanus]ETN68509.1 hypothetical protein NECAME_05592 [Necator americanus]